MSAKTGIRLVLVALLAAGSAVPVAFTQEIGLQPASVELEIAPGARTRQIVTLANKDRSRPVSGSLSFQNGRSMRPWLSWKNVDTYIANSPIFSM